MTREEYDRALMDIDANATSARNQLAIDYCLEHNTVKLGDFFTDHNGTIKVEAVSVCVANLCCVYYGPGYTKKLKPKKNTDQVKAWQCNEVKP
jgi:hypothetical protein